MIASGRREVGMGRRVFISYDHSDGALVKSGSGGIGLATSLETDRHDVYYDEHLQDEPGVNWWERILDEIEACDLFIAVLSLAYAESRPCRLEWEYASQLERTVLAIHEDELDAGLFPPALAEAQWLLYRPTDT